MLCASFFYAGESLRLLNLRAFHSTMANAPGSPRAQTEQHRAEIEPRLPDPHPREPAGRNEIADLDEAGD